MIPPIFILASEAPCTNELIKYHILQCLENIFSKFNVTHVSDINDYSVQMTLKVCKVQVLPMTILLTVQRDGVGVAVEQYAHGFSQLLANLSSLLKLIYCSSNCDFTGF